MLFGEPPKKSDKSVSMILRAWISCFVLLTTTHIFVSEPGETESLLAAAAEISPYRVDEGDGESDVDQQPKWSSPIGIQ